MWSQPRDAAGRSGIWALRHAHSTAISGIWQCPTFECPQSKTVDAYRGQSCRDLAPTVAPARGLPPLSAFAKFETLLS